MHAYIREFLKGNKGKLAITRSQLYEQLRPRSKAQNAQNYFLYTKNTTKDAQHGKITPKIHPQKIAPRAAETQEPPLYPYTTLLLLGEESFLVFWIAPQNVTQQFQNYSISSTTYGLARFQFSDHFVQISPSCDLAELALVSLKEKREKNRDFRIISKAQDRREFDFTLHFRQVYNRYSLQNPKISRIFQKIACIFASQNAKISLWAVFFDLEKTFLRKNVLHFRQELNEL